MFIVTEDGDFHLGEPLQDTPKHFYKNVELHHGKWWSNEYHEAEYDDLFRMKDGSDMRMHPNWGKRSVTSVSSSLFANGNGVSRQSGNVRL